jgi:hypothetical protein
MAKRRVNRTDERKSLDKKAYFVDEITSVVDRAVHDEEAAALLAAILAALGGSSDTTPTIFNLNTINQGQEYSQALPANTKAFIIRSRKKGRLRLAYEMGGTNANYVTIPNGSSLKDTNLYTSVTLYIQSTKPGDVIEIVAYT